MHKPKLMVMIKKKDLDMVMFAMAGNTDTRAKACHFKKLDVLMKKVKIY